MRIYLDHAATTPVDNKVYATMKPFFSENFYNPSALYREGVVIRRAIEVARERIAKSLGCGIDEIIFTSGGTESDNLAIIGTIREYARTRAQIGKPHVITSAIEHPAILASCRSLVLGGEAEVTYIGVDARGIVNPKEIRDALCENTALVSVMHANNEIGTVQPIHAIAKIVRDWRRKKNSPYPYLHTDACQSVNYLDTNVARLGVDMLTLNGSKIYGPKGIGVLYIKRDVVIAPVIRGGGQEFGLRAGTENVPGIIGFAEALAITERLKEEEAARLAPLRDRLIAKITAAIPDSFLNGDAKERLPNNVNISIPRVDSERLIIELDARGIACSARSACKSAEDGSSHVIMALSAGTDGLSGVVRFTLGRATRQKDVDYTAEALNEILKRISV